MVKLKYCEPLFTLKVFNVKMLKVLLRLEEPEITGTIDEEGRTLVRRPQQLLHIHFFSHDPSFATCHRSNNKHSR